MAKCIIHVQRGEIQEEEQRTETRLDISKMWFLEELPH